jgi:hypothetical protein
VPRPAEAMASCGLCRGAHTYTGRAIRHTAIEHMCTANSEVLHVQGGCQALTCRAAPRELARPTASRRCGSTLCCARCATCCSDCAACRAPPCAARTASAGPPGAVGACCRMAPFPASCAALASCWPCAEADMRLMSVARCRQVVVASHADAEDEICAVRGARAHLLCCGLQTLPHITACKALGDRAARRSKVVVSSEAFAGAC